MPIAMTDIAGLLLKVQLLAKIDLLIESILT
jgi:hypothetical protein